jgi:hypothetical protein
MAAELRITCRKIVQNLSGLRPESLPETDGGVPLLTEDFSDITLDDLDLPPELISILRSRLDEASFCLSAGAHLAVVILSGSVLEGLLLGLAKGSPHRFNQAKSAPKDRDGQVRRLAEWSLAHLIEAATELRFLSPDVKQFSSALREFRNYVHPNQQLEARFQPDEHTARISLQVLRAAIADVTGLRGSRRPIESGP